MDEIFQNADVRLAEMERAAVETSCELLPANRRLAGTFSKLAEMIRFVKEEVTQAATLASL